MTWHYEISIDHYGGPKKATCMLKKEVDPLIIEMKKDIFGGIGYVRVCKVTTKDISNDFKGTQ